ncbi:hypothetical protein BJY01DRAFT_248501 [Aspergillus pseudoustus]|uniref:Rhodopsin domain-containing protein n=1 Tax=Aspergillus pseudoustus TaxID=1810923 RepID=A0ABR4JUK4_9EURO
MVVPEDKVSNMIFGSKLAFINWIWYMCYIWCLKAAINNRAGAWHRQLVVATSVFCVIIWLTCVLTHVCLCLPVHRNWQIKPYPGDHCTLRQPLYVGIAVFNVISDLCIIPIPIPILAKLQVPIQRKVVLALMFCSGFFIMICTILRAYYSLKSISSLPVALGWADRECFVAAIITPLPGIKPCSVYTSEGYNNFGSKASGNTKTFISSKGGRSAKRGRHFELDSVLATTKGPGTRVSSGDSEEYFLESPKERRPSVMMPQPRNDLAIHVTTEYTLESSRGTKDNSNI